MLRQIMNRFSNLSTRATIVVAFATIVVASGIAYLITRGPSAEADTSVQPIAARIDQVDGSVGIARTSADNEQPDWTEATINTPVSIGDRIYARSGSHASIALTGHDLVRLNPEASLDVLALADRRTQLALRSGSAMFDVGSLASDEVYEVATPCGAVNFAQPGLYQIGLDSGNAVISVLNGEARVIDADGSGDITKGQVFTLACASPDQAEASTIAPDLAGEIVDGYYRERYAKVYDGRYRNYDTYLEDPNFYDPYRTSPSCQYVSADIPGLNDLDYYGDWVDLDDYGHSWAPRVSAGWAPYHAGYWVLDDTWGPTWVASESWGWAPYHYGRWTFVSNRWFWVPEVRTRPAYSPAPVAFFSIGEQIAWVPLGPREVYVPRYYDRNFSPRYLASSDVINGMTRQRTFVNFNAPGAVTVVGVNSLRGAISPGRFTTGDPNVVARSRVLLDPLSVDGVRQLTANRDDARQRIKLARSEQAVFNTPVVSNAKLTAAPGRPEFARAWNVQAVPDKGKGNKLKINQSAEATTVRRPDGLPQQVVSSAARERQMSALATRAEQGDKSARREMRQVMREQQGTGQQPAVQQPTAGGQQQQVEQSREQMKQQRRAERQQQSATAGQQDAARQAQQQQNQQQMKQQRKVERQQQQTAPASQQATREAQQQQMKQQRKAERQQQQTAPASQQAAREAQQQQMKQQRKVDRQQQQAAAASQQQQTKQQRQVERQQQQVRPQPQEVRPQPKPPKQKPPDAQLEQQRQAMMQQQQAAQARQAQRQSMIQQQQAARAPQAQHQVAQPATQKGPQLMGPPVRQNEPQRNGDAPRRKPSGQ